MGDVGVSRRALALVLLALVVLQSGAVLAVAWSLQLLAAGCAIATLAVLLVLLLVDVDRAPRGGA